MTVRVGDENIGFEPHYAVQCMEWFFGAEINVLTGPLVPGTFVF